MLIINEPKDINVPCFKENRVISLTLFSLKVLKNNRNDNEWEIKYNNNNQNHSGELAYGIFLKKFGLTDYLDHGTISKIDEKMLKQSTRRARLQKRRI